MSNCVESQAGNNPPAACSTAVTAAVPAVNGDGLVSKFSRLLTGVNFGSLRRLLFNKDILGLYYFI